MVLVCWVAWGLLLVLHYTTEKGSDPAAPKRVGLGLHDAVYSLGTCRIELKGPICSARLKQQVRSCVCVPLLLQQAAVHSSWTALDRGLCISLCISLTTAQPPAYGIRMTVIISRQQLLIQDTEGSRVCARADRCNIS